jgi:non-specific serine/threonine protein kinase/serine/threonine-protein kinase
LVDDDRHCPECGRTLERDSAGLCPVCLLKRGLDDRDLADPTSSPTEPGGPLPIPERIGPYRIVRRLGEGGMGVVFLAEQVEDLERQVAIKLIKHGVDSKQVLARFEVERQALALMDHPGIARVLDAGTAERGEPYFVMEYVDGLPITAFCDRHALSMRARLELFARVCDAVQHAHRRGIIHRDLKPSNILVAESDQGPVPKVIDFGVAKATAQRRLEWSVFTEMGYLIGTPEYMSPEQADTSGFDVDTRTDVYSLGVVLYELLVGCTPHDARALREAGLQVMLREIRERDCPTPSARFSTLGADSTAVASARSTDPAALLRQLRGEVEWIVMRAVEKERDRRYDSPHDLAADVERFLGNRAVLAGPPSATYRLRKFVRRHRLGVAVGAAVLLLAVGLFAREWVQARRIAQERDRANIEAEAARQVADFMIGLFRVSDPGEARGNSITAREILDRGAQEIEETLADQPQVQARMMGTMGEVYMSLGLFEPAEPLIQRAVSATRELLGENHAETLRAMGQRAILYWNQGRYDEAETLHAKVLEARERQLGPDHPDTLVSVHNLALAIDGQGRLDEAAPLYRRSLEGRERALGRDDPDTLKSRNSLANVLIQLGEYEDAESLHRATMESRRRLLGDDHPSTLISQYNVTVTQLYQGRLDRAERTCRETLEARRRVLGDEHPQTLLSLNLLAVIYQNQGRYDEAEPVIHEVYETEKRLRGPEHPKTLTYMMNVALNLQLQERSVEAERLLRENLEITRRVRGDEHPTALNAMENLAATLEDLGRYEEAETLYLECRSGRERRLGDDHELVARVMQNLGSLYLETGRYDEARPLFERAREIYNAKLPPGHPHAVLNLSALADLLRRIGEAEEAAILEQEIQSEPDEHARHPPGS